MVAKFPSFSRNAPRRAGLSTSELDVEKSFKVHLRHGSQQCLQLLEDHIRVITDRRQAKEARFLELLVDIVYRNEIVDIVFEDEAFKLKGDTVPICHCGC